MTNYNIVENKQYNSYEIYFSSMPPKQTRDNLKALKMRYNGFKKCWYGFQSIATLEKAINYKTTPEKKQEAKKEAPQGVSLPNAPKKENNSIIKTLKKFTASKNSIKEALKEITFQDGYIISCDSYTAARYHDPENALNVQPVDGYPVNMGRLFNNAMLNDHKINISIAQIERAKTQYMIDNPGAKTKNALINIEKYTFKCDRLKSALKAAKTDYIMVNNTTNTRPAYITGNGLELIVNPCKRF